MPTATVVPPTVIAVTYPRHRGAIGLRGNHAPLSWDHTTPPVRADGDQHIFIVQVPAGETLDLKLVRDDQEWANGRNYAVHAGEHLHLEPAFDRAKCELLPPAALGGDQGGRLVYQVLVPPSYGEQDDKRYPVIYALDGQALWTTSQDPFGVWRLDETLNELYELAVIEELVVVAIDTSESRLDRLGPVPDKQYLGGKGADHLRAIIDTLKPQVDATYRTRTGPEDTAIMGSSMGGLFAFYAAWTRPAVFGKAICLSSSFWWANRHMIRVVSTAPEPRPVIYLDSGAALNPGELEANDNFHDTRAMHRALGRAGYTPAELHRLTFPGQGHNAASWAARVGLPLQLLFPAAQVHDDPMLHARPHPH